MTIRVARCQCGQLQARCSGEPVRISVCHCLDCQRRSGSAFSVQARWPDGDVTMDGDFSEWARRGDSGAVVTQRFCGICGTVVAYVVDEMPELTAIPVGGFGDPTFPSPAFSVYETRKYPWVDIAGDDIEHRE